MTARILNIILFIVISVFSCKKPIYENLSFDSVESKIENIFKSDELSIICVGDIMMGTTYPYKDLPPADGKYLLNEVSEILADADLTLGNLEGVFLDSGGTPKKCKTDDHCYSFRIPVRYAEYLKDAGFDFLNLANNHSGDMGREGRESTYKTLDDLEIAYAGTADYPYEILVYKGKKIAIACFAPNAGTPDINNINSAAERVKFLKNNYDYVIVSFHGGAEGAGAQRVPKNVEYFLGEKRGDVFAFAHSVIDAGADLVFGHGPHVTRAVELYKNKFIAYSLGNFCTYGKFSLSGPQGIAPVLKIFIGPNGDFIRAEVISVKQVNRGHPVPDETKSAFYKIKELTIKDFPDTDLDFTDDCVIRPRNK